MPYFVPPVVDQASQNLTLGACDLSLFTKSGILDRTAMLPIAQNTTRDSGMRTGERDRFENREKEDKQVTEENPIFDTSQTHDFHSTQTSFWISPETQHMHLQQAILFKLSKAR